MVGDEGEGGVIAGLVAGLIAGDDDGEIFFRGEPGDGHPHGVAAGVGEGGAASPRVAVGELSLPRFGGHPPPRVSTKPGQAHFATDDVRDLVVEERVFFRAETILTPPAGARFWMISRVAISQALTARTIYWNIPASYAGFTASPPPVRASSFSSISFKMVRDGAVSNL